MDPLLRIKAEELVPREKLVTLGYDEVHIKSDISYKKETDQFIGRFDIEIIVVKTQFINSEIIICNRDSNE